MPNVKQARKAEEIVFFDEIYKIAKMGADAIIALLPHVKEDALRSLMTQQLDGYEKYAARAERELERLGEKAREENILTRWSARISMAFHTMLNSTTGQIAKMMVEGSNMAITDTVRLLNAYGTVSAAQGAVLLGRELVSFEEHNLERLRHFL